MSAERIYSTPWSDYELIDAGGGKKLERWGKIITIRPEVQAYFKSEKTFKEWEQMAHWEFVSKGGQSGVWKALKKDVPRQWSISFEKLHFHLELTKFKHLGLFPEQRTNWDFIKKHIGSDDKFLNLFAYTGAASCVARYTGAETYHVDSVKQLISWARQNMEESRLLNIKWVLEDALKFVVREQKRGNKYKGIIMDPPAWGLGAKGEKWKLEEKIDELLATAASLMEEDGFLIMNTYSPTLDNDMISSLAEMYFEGRQIEVKELWMKTTTGKDLYFGNLLRVGKFNQ
ncbi:MAG: class I SAM-dependent methyltransferase [Flavobacteriia bacterium]|jgi:23S rRNA (cytosine1962-C5)-methyltransferase